MTTNTCKVAGCGRPTHGNANAKCYRHTCMPLPRRIAGREERRY